MQPAALPSWIYTYRNREPVAVSFRELCADTAMAKVKRRPIIGHEQPSAYSKAGRCTMRRVIHLLRSLVHRCTQPAAVCLWRHKSFCFCIACPAAWSSCLQLTSTYSKYWRKGQLSPSKRLILRTNRRVRDTGGFHVTRSLSSSAAVYASTIPFSIVK